MTQRIDGATGSGEATAMATQTEDLGRLAEHIAVAKARIEAGDLEGGLVAFRRIAEEQPTIPEVFNNLGAICAAMGRHEEAEAAFTRATLLTPDTANPWYNRGLMRFQSGQYSGALADFERATELDPTDPEFRNNEGVVRFQMREFEAARAAFESALALRPSYLAAQMNLVDIDLAEGNFDAAQEAARGLAEIHGEPEVLEKFLECSLVAALHQLEKAHEDCEWVQTRGAGADFVEEQSLRILRAKQALLGEDTAPTPVVPFAF